MVGILNTLFLPVKPFDIRFLWIPFNHFVSYLKLGFTRLMKELFRIVDLINKMSPHKIQNSRTMYRNAHKFQENQLYQYLHLKLPHSVFFCLKGNKCLQLQKPIDVPNKEKVSETTKNIIFIQYIFI
jgi:hypothetical protein